MQKPTIERCVFEDVVDIQYWKVIDTDGKEHIYYWEVKANPFYQSELAKWQAEQEPQILFESGTVKVMKFTDSTQLELWINKGTGYGILKHQTLFDCSKPILFTKIEDCEMWYAVCNISPDLIKAVQSVNVATIQYCECDCCVECGECENPINVEDNFCSECGKTLIKEVE